MFAHKMGELSDTFGLGYEVCAKPLDQAILAQEPFDAVMLAPQVAFERNRVAAAYPEALVFEIPARIFGGYDAAGAVRLLSNAPDGHNRSAKEWHDQAMMPQDLAWLGRIMVVTAVLGSRQSTFKYRVIERGETVFAGKTAKRVFDFRDVEDLLAGVRLQGINVGRFDAIGIAVPGIVGEGSVVLPSLGLEDRDLGARISRAYDVPVFLDNDANAAAVGCSYLQSSYGSITYQYERWTMKPDGAREGSGTCTRTRSRRASSGAGRWPPTSARAPGARAARA